MTITEYYEALPEAQKAGFLQEMKKDMEEASAANAYEMNHGMDCGDNGASFEDLDLT